MRTGLIFLTLAVFASVSCDFDIVPNQELQPAQTLKFLGNSAGGPGEVTIELNCSDESTLINTDARCDPAVVTKGVDITLYAKTIASEDIQLSKIHVQANLNGSPAFSDEKDQTDLIKAGEEFSYRYSTTVPSFIPQGVFDITLNLVDATGKKVSCIGFKFDF
eukprot:CAMPEP_0170514258 /NCGR_PEP_ID=MMETSP0209-20121228/822_1 /TAXON_ID=665100 ORGANISM="Litonotus pictus, Strain P1" /NCGR_SAMPLE_ID=MMETSP0209 /ASSEMBLY_ACC=CAM_ASM_000301 /LENGTH=162 /DNA_ID=CAMNT_0010798277 /DNA_START=9 /DNA_END=497 /DNA_ORIENTATION=+